MTVDTFESLGLAARGRYHGGGVGGGLSTRDATPYIVRWMWEPVQLPISFRGLLEVSCTIVTQEFRTIIVADLSKCRHLRCWELTLST